jgi:hypothetical protein
MGFTLDQEDVQVLTGLLRSRLPSLSPLPQPAPLTRAPPSKRGNRAVHSSVHPPFQQQSQQQQGTDANTFSSSAGNGSARDAASITAPSVPVVFPLNAQVSLPDAHACVAWALFSFAHKLVCQSTHTRTHTHTLHTHTHSLTHHAHTHTSCRPL